MDRAPLPWTIWKKSSRIACGLLVACVLLCAGCEQTVDPEAEQARLLKQAGKALAEKQYDAALNFVDAATKAAPVNTTVYTVQGNIYWFARRYDAAAEAYERACRLDTDLEMPDPSPRVGAGFAFLRVGDTTAADRYLAEAYDLYGDQLAHAEADTEISDLTRTRKTRQARLHRACITALRGNAASAISQIERMQQIHPEWNGGPHWIELINSGMLEDFLITDS